MYPNPGPSPFVFGDRLEVPMPRNLQATIAYLALAAILLGGLLAAAGLGA